MRYFKKLLGEKCYLSPMNPDDTEQYVAWLNDLEVSENLRAASKNISLVNERAHLERLAEGHVYAIVDLKTDTLIGNVALIDIDHLDRQCKLGIFIGNKDYWGKGYGREAIRLLLGFAFNRLNMNNVLLNVYAPNERAYRCYRSVGFREIGRRRQSVFRNGVYCDDIYMDILAEDFRKGA